MIRKIAGGLLSDKQKRKVKTLVSQSKQAYAQTFRNYNNEQLIAAVREVGVEPGDTVMVHANFPNDSGFEGAPADMADALAAAVGAEGNLLMMSIPYRGTAFDYLEKGKTYDARRTISMMGLVTELFRRREGTLRSLHPTHPVLASGPDAAAMVADHEQTVFPCGAGSPLEKLHQMGGKILFVDVSFAAITFFHYLEDLFKDKVAADVYEDREFVANVKDEAGKERQVKTLAFKRGLVRDTQSLYDELQQSGDVRSGSIGTTTLELVDCEAVVAAMQRLIEGGNSPIREKT